MVSPTATHAATLRLMLQCVAVFRAYLSPPVWAPRLVMPVFPFEWVRAQAQCPTRLTMIQTVSAPL